MKTQTTITDKNWQSMVLSKLTSYIALAISPIRNIGISIIYGLQILHWRKFLNGEFFNLEFSSMEKKEDYSSKENIIMETNKLVRRIFSIGEQ